MIVSELIEKLLELPADAQIIICVDDNEASDFTLDEADTGEYLLDGDSD